MNRKEFFKKLGLGALVVCTAPKLLTKAEPHMLSAARHDDITEVFKDGWHIQTVDDYVERIRHCPFTFDECVKEADYRLVKAQYDMLWKK